MAGEAQGLSTQMNTDEHRWFVSGSGARTIQGFRFLVLRPEPETQSERVEEGIALFVRQ
jgi:hypothetical protein